MIAIYRWDNATAAHGNAWKPRPTRRPPGNVPYLVDNLWEWARPDGMPNRRHALYASPTPSLARANGGASDGAVFVVEARDACAAQLACKDAREHPDVKALLKLLLSLLPGWGDLPLADKAAEAPLWAPLLGAGEVQHILDTSIRLRPHIDQIRAAITFWMTAQRFDPVTDSALPNPEGEVFLECAQCQLIPLDEYPGPSGE